MIEFVVLGEPASAKNSRRLVRFGTRIASIKSKKALNYLTDLRKQVRKLPELLTGDLTISIWIWYASRRPDLDEAGILDALQGLIYENDRQIKEKHIYHGLDKINPRARVVIEALKQVNLS